MAKLNKNLIKQENRDFVVDLLIQKLTEKGFDVGCHRGMIYDIVLNIDHIKLPKGCQLLVKE